MDRPRDGDRNWTTAPLGDAAAASEMVTAIAAVVYAAGLPVLVYHKYCTVLVAQLVRALA